MSRSLSLHAPSEPRIRPLASGPTVSFIRILSNLSTAMNSEFHWVAFGRSSWMEQRSSAAPAARVDGPHLFLSP
ncbi:unnamed protein product [Pleuronectes platessa]|uniref:Uncharacterized protein n=1 Tax=Pleuronectes platessa TaxID=8262 RepID=A0A9N7Z521_PLEPL|nr:unnamed protein product [Pleuronectes platessa]